MPTLKFLVNLLIISVIFKCRIGGSICWYKRDRQFLPAIR